MARLRAYGGHPGLVRLIESLDAQLDATDAASGATAGTGRDGVAAAPDAL